MAFLEMVGVRKRFGGVVALNGASLSCEAGEVHALLGANGSGKSTLNKVLTGVVRADEGEVRLRGARVSISGPTDMQKYNIAAVHQELSLVPQLSVADNIVLSREPVNALGFVRRKRLVEEARAVAARFEEALGRSFDMHETVDNLSPSDQQLVEIFKALSRNPDILILDEATASLHREEVQALFSVVRELKERGVLVIFVSHRLDEVFDICDRATVLRNGSTVGTISLQEATEAQIVNMMVGDVERIARRQAMDVEEAPVVLDVQGLAAANVHDVSFELRAGEVLGLGGLQGQGQSDLLRALFGVTPASAGRIVIGGHEASLRRPKDAMRQGIAYIPGDRGRQGLFLRRPILENLTFASMSRRARPGGVLHPARERSVAREIAQELQIKIGDLTDPVNTLSGGNQQKVVVGKWLLNEPRILLMDDPTKGVDIGAKAEIYDLIDELTRRGVAVILNSSENMELLNVSDRILVLYEGRIVESLTGDQLTENHLVAASLRVTASA